MVLLEIIKFNENIIYKNLTKNIYISVIWINIKSILYIKLFNYKPF